MESLTANLSQQTQSKDQQCQQPAAPTSTSTASGKNVKNLSIKEFFTTRLMRARSFEGGGNSPKDETTSWFDEFKARMTKKSQANSAKQNKTTGATDDGSEPEYVEATEVSEKKSKSAKHGNQKEETYQTDSSAKNICDNQPKSLGIESVDSLDSGRLRGNFDAIEGAYEQYELKDMSGSPESSAITSGLRTKQNNKISSARCPDFDTASINTIFNRRDSRYDAIKKKRQPKSPSNLGSVFRWLLSQALPFNYNLPWKFMTLINLSFLIIALAMVSKFSPGYVAFNFFNGFICGVLIAALCFFVLVLSLLLQFLPSSTSQEDTQLIQDESTNRLVTSPNIRTPNVSFIGCKRKKTIHSEKVKCDSGEETDIEDIGGGGTKSENNLDDEDYKGWMIEFVGDYEQRHKSEFKLKLLYVKIEDRVLHLCKPKNSHDAESATFPVFSSQRTYDLNVAKKFSANIVLPKTVRNRQKWVWSKKYPIKLEFQDPAELVQPLTTAKTSGVTITSENTGPKMIQLTLFAKSCREKEEWFRRFKRIIEDNRVALGHANKRASIKSGDSDDIFINICTKSKRGISPSPSLRQDRIQTSRSSHIFSDPSSSEDYTGDSNDDADESSINLTRTKSCELLNAGNKSSGDSSNEQEGRYAAADEAGQQFDPQDDSTLTKETAELFSQAIEYSNFLESQPTLNYREYIERVIESSGEATSTSDWFNSLTGRIFFDVFSHNFWSVWFKRKIQRKLYRIRLPYFMETLTLTQIDLGSNAPQFLNVVSHSFDSFGLSIDFDMAYSGGLTMTFATKLNLLKIKADNSAPSSNNTSTNSNTTATGPTTSSSTTSATSMTGNQVTDPNQVASELPLPLNKDSPSSTGAACSDNSANSKEDSSKYSLSSSASTRTSGESDESDESDSDTSSDSSFDEAEADEISDWEDYGAEKTRQSIVKFVDKIASSRYFQSATENKYIKKKLQDISNCPLVLVVKIVSLNGVLTVNVPPPQTDRVWYGFKPNPELTLKALPKMGDREVNLSHVTDWIERKLAEEFRKILVIPNMEDIVLPVLKSDHLIYVTSTK